MAKSEIENWLRRIRLGEDSSLELKRVVWRGEHKIAGSHADSLADELAAFANAHGGDLILGVDDASKQVLGIPETELETLEKWLSEIGQTRIDPPLDFKTRHIELPDAEGVPRPVIVVRIPRSVMVHCSPNGYFKRVGDAKRKMKPDVLARLFQQRSQSRLIRFEEQAVAGAALSDANPLLLKKFIQAHEGEPELQLRRLHLVADDDGRPRLSVAGVLLATNKPTDWLPAAYIQAVAYTGTSNDPDQQIGAKDFDGPLDYQIWQAYGFVYLHMKIPARKVLGRVDYPQYSLRAVFEALVNAVAHRDYSIGNNRIRLHLFSDRLELYTPGALPNSMSLESMRLVSMPRNELIASLFAKYYRVRETGLGREYLMDRRGSGVDVILDESERLSGLRPVYRNLDDLELGLTIFAANLEGR